MLDLSIYLSTYARQAAGILVKLTVKKGVCVCDGGGGGCNQQYTTTKNK